MIGLATRRGGAPERFMRDLVALLGLPAENADARSKLGRELTLFRMPSASGPVRYRFSETFRGALRGRWSRAAEVEVVFDDADSGIARLEGVPEEGATIEAGPFETPVALAAALL